MELKKYCILYHIKIKNFPGLERIVKNDENFVSDNFEEEKNVISRVNIFLQRAK